MGGQARRKDRRPGPPDRGRRIAGDHHSEISGRRSDLPPLDRTLDGAGGQAPLPGRSDRNRSADRKRLLLRLQSGTSLHAGGPLRDRSGNAKDHRGGPSDRPRGDADRAGDRDLRRAERLAEGRDRAGHSGRRAGHVLPPGRVRGPLPRPARRVDGKTRSLPADAHGGGLLEGRREEPDAPADLRGVLPDAEGARRAPPAAGGSPRPRSSQARQGARARRVPPVGAGVAVLPSEGDRHLQRPARVPARGIRAAGLPGGHDAADLRRGALQALRPLPELLREHVLDGHRRAGVRRQADELPRPLPALQDAALVLPRPARAPRRLRPAAPLRALGRDRRTHARPVLLAGRRPHLHALRQGRGRDLPLPRVHGRGLRSVRLHRRARSRSACARRSESVRTSSGLRESGPSRRLSRRRTALTS